MKKVENILAGVGQIILGKEEAISKIFTGILCGGHILIEDVPGVGKTTLVNAFAKVLGCTFRRIQFTPDLMPADIIGISVYDREKQEFTFKPGPIMSQIILADEINRTSPKTQASLLEAMAEGRITVDGVTHSLPAPFLVLATQNPIEYEGTFPLPEAQLDRFMMRISIGYPGYDNELDILQIPAGSAAVEELEAVIAPAELLDMQKRVESVYMAASLLNYTTNLTRNTRSHPDVLLGISPRGGQHLYRGAKAAAFIAGRDYVLPDDIKSMAVPVFSHRLILTPEARLKGKTTVSVLTDILHDTPVPVAQDGKK